MSSLELDDKLDRSGAFLCTQSAPEAVTRYPAKAALWKAQRQFQPESQLLSRKSIGEWVYHCPLPGRQRYRYTMIALSLLKNPNGIFVLIPKGDITFRGRDDIAYRFGAAPDDIMYGFNRPGLP